MVKCCGLTVYSYIPNDDGAYTEIDDLPPEKKEERRKLNAERLGKAIEEMYIKNPRLAQKHYEQGLIYDP